MTKGLFVGSFDPVTLGHVDLIERSLHVVDDLLIAVSVNTHKTNWLSIDQRVKLLKDLYQERPSIQIVRFENQLTVEFARLNQVNVLIRGLRTAADFTYEQQIGQMNKELAPEIETIYLITDPRYQHVSSSMAREIAQYNGDLSLLLPDSVAQSVQRIKSKTS